MLNQGEKGILIFATILSESNKTESWPTNKPAEACEATTGINAGCVLGEVDGVCQRSGTSTSSLSNKIAAAPGSSYLQLIQLLSDEKLEHSNNFQTKCVEFMGFVPACLSRIATSSEKDLKRYLRFDRFTRRFNRPRNRSLPKHQNGAIF